MKEILNFVVWQWNKFQTWQKGYIVGAFFVGAGIMAPQPWSNYIFAVPMIMLFCWTAKWWIWDELKKSWNKYQDEKQNLFNTIKDSHK